MGFPWLWGPITLRGDIRLKWGLKQNCSSHRELSNGMLHTTCTQGNQLYSWLLVVGSQIANLTFGFSFGHNLCFKCPNGSCEPILGMYALRDFQRYKKIFNPLSFDPYNCLLKIQESIGTPSPKEGVHLGVWRFIPSHFPTLPRTCGVTLGLALGPQPYKLLCLAREPKVRVTT
jgi:hypothetical protein